MSSDNSGKRRRMAHEGCDGLLQRLLHMGGVSNAGLSNILQEIRRSIPADLPGCSASQINQAALDRFMGLRFVDRLALADDEGFVEFEYVDPAAFLSTSISESPLLARTFRAALETAPSSPSSPWRLVLGFDEFAPGNKLKTDNRRKTMVMSFSFLELGQALGRLAVKFVRAPPLASGMCWVSDAYRFSVSLRPPSCEAVRFPRSFRGGRTTCRAKRLLPKGRFGMRVGLVHLRRSADIQDPGSPGGLAGVLGGLPAETSARPKRFVHSGRGAGLGDADSAVRQAHPHGSWGGIRDTAAPGCI